MKKNIKKILIGLAAVGGLWYVLRPKAGEAATPDEGLVLTELNAIDITSDFSLNDGHITAHIPLGATFKIKLYDNVMDAGWTRIYNPSYLTMINEIIGEGAIERVWEYTFNADVAGDTSFFAEHGSITGFDKSLVFNLRIA